MIGPLLPLLLSLTASAMAAPSTPADTVFTDALKEAERKLRPLIVVHKPANCRREDQCDYLDNIIGHPAIQRRLENDVLIFMPTEGSRAAIEVYDPSGWLAVRWEGAPDAITFRQMLTQIDGVRTNLIGAYHAFVENDADRTYEERALACFGLGLEEAGTEYLEHLREQGKPEARQLATIWLRRVAATDESDELRAEQLNALANNGASDRVRFEAWMTIGEMAVTSGTLEGSLTAYRRALDHARTDSERATAREAISVVMQHATPVLGLGNPETVVAGRRTLQPRWRDPAVRSVEYLLDGNLVARTATPPFAAAVDFGRNPRRHELELRGHNESGEVVRSAVVQVNDGGGPFAVEIVSPKDLNVSGAVTVDVDVRFPPGRNVEQVTVDWNGSPACRLSAPPYSCELRLTGKEIGVLRAGATLDDGSESEDVRLLNAGEIVFESDVQLAEIPIYSEKGQPRPDDLVLREDGAIREVDRVIAPQDSPLFVTLLIDVSSSMANDILDLEDAAVRFVDEVLQPRDRVMIVAFDTKARVALWPTRERARIGKAIMNLRVKGATALDDAIVMALLQTQPTGSRRAIVVLSDGADNASVFDQQDVLEVAKSSAIPIYVVVLNPLPAGTARVAREQRAFARIGRLSGGDAYLLRSMGKLDKFWKEIAEDLAKQYLLIYRPGVRGNNWRELDISLRGGGTLRAPSGIYTETRNEPEEP